MNETAFRKAREKWQEAEADVQRLAPGWPNCDTIASSMAATLAAALDQRARAEEAMRTALVMEGDSFGSWMASGDGPWLWHWTSRDW